MTAIDLLLGHPDRLEKVANDIINHYEELEEINQRLFKRL